MTQVHAYPADLENRARAASAAVAEKAGEIASKAGQQLDQTLDSAAATARQVAEQTREAGERVNEVAGNLKSALDRSIKDQPMTTLAVAAAVGFVVGAIWKS